MCNVTSSRQLPTLLLIVYFYKNRYHESEKPGKAVCVVCTMFKNTMSKSILTDWLMILKLSKRKNTEIYKCILYILYSIPKSSFITYHILQLFPNTSCNNIVKCCIVWDTSLLNLCVASIGMKEIPDNICMYFRWKNRISFSSHYDTVSYFERNIFIIYNLQSWQNKVEHFFKAILGLYCRNPVTLSKPILLPYFSWF